MARPCFRGAVVLVLLVVPALASAQGPPQGKRGLETRVAALEAAVTSLQTTVAALQTTVSTQAGQIAALNGQIATLQGMDVELESRIASVENSETMKLNSYLEVTTDAELNLPLVRFTGVNLQLVMSPNTQNRPVRNT